MAPGSYVVEIKRIFLFLDTLFAIYRLKKGTYTIVSYEHTTWKVRSWVVVHPSSVFAVAPVTGNRKNFFLQSTSTVVKDIH